MEALVGYACRVNGKLCFPIHQTEADAKASAGRILNLVLIEDPDGSTANIDIAVVEIRLIEPQRRSVS